MTSDFYDRRLFERRQMTNFCVGYCEERGLQWNGEDENFCNSTKLNNFFFYGLSNIVHTVSAGKRNLDLFIILNSFSTFFVS